MSEYSWATIKRLVHERAEGICEYCLTSEENSGQTMQVDHIEPDGGDVLENLCLSCWNCNNHKRKATAITDPVTQVNAALYNPRTQRWNDHFAWIDGASRILGLTPIGRATVIRLKMNRSAIVIARQ
jgi:hypothetical protein